MSQLSLDSASDCPTILEELVEHLPIPQIYLDLWEKQGSSFDPAGKLEQWQKLNRKEKGVWQRLVFVTLLALGFAVLFAACGVVFHLTALVWSAGVFMVVFLCLVLWMDHRKSPYIERADARCAEEIQKFLWFLKELANMLNLYGDFEGMVRSIVLQGELEQAVDTRLRCLALNQIKAEKELEDTNRRDKHVLHDLSKKAIEEEKQFDRHLARFLEMKIECRGKRDYLHGARAHLYDANEF